MLGRTATHRRERHSQSTEPGCGLNPLRCRCAITTHSASGQSAQRKAVVRPDRTQNLAMVAVAEGGFGNYDDKVTKIGRQVTGAPEEWPSRARRNPLLRPTEPGLQAG